MTHKNLLDIDIASGIDDGVCLAYLHANPQFEALGIHGWLDHPKSLIEERKFHSLHDMAVDIANNFFIAK